MSPTTRVDHEAAKRIAGTMIFNGIPHEIELARAYLALAPRLAAYEALCARLKLEAETHAQEARTQHAIVLDCYKAVNGGRAGLADWNGAEPVRAKVAEMEAALREIQSKADAYGADPITAADYPSSHMKLSQLLLEIDESRSALSASPPQSSENRAAAGRGGEEA